MRFDFEAYEKVFPKEEPKIEIESAVDTFKPTESEKAGGDPAGDTTKAIPDAEPENKPKEPELKPDNSDNGEKPEGGNDE